MSTHNICFYEYQLTFLQTAYEMCFQGVGLFESTSGPPDTKPILILVCQTGEGRYFITNFCLSIFKTNQ